ncbi:MAG: dephospho-CoA kinase [Chitinophagales bacterium]
MKRRKTSTHQVIKVGIIGGIGSGKSTVCKMFEKLGIPVYYADERAKYLMQHEHHLIDEIRKTFGADIYDNGSLNRKLLSERVFNNSSKLQQLNALVHPAVFRDTEEWVEEQKALKVPYVLKEAALLIESGSYKNLDRLIVVSAPLEIRIKRVIDRDHSTREEILARINHQLPDEDKMKLADYVIENSGDLKYLEQQVLEIHKKLILINLEISPTSL